MSWTLDIIIALIIGLTIFFAVKNGLIKTAISAVSFILALIVTASFASPLASTLKDTSIADTVREATEEQITDALLEGSHEIPDLVAGESEEFNTLIGIAGISNDELSQWFAENVIDESTAESALAEKLSEPIIDLIAMLTAVIILFFGTQIVLSIVASLLDKIARLPVLNTFNKAGGLIIGIVLALVRVCLFCFIVDVLIDNAAFIGNDMISGLDPEKTLLFKIFHNINIFDFFIS